jgi:uncharacterized membrane protein (UPF0182 family)
MRYFAIAAGAVAVLLIAWVIVAAVSTEALWFTSLGYSQVYWKILLAKTTLWLCGAVAAFFWFWLNFRAAVRGKSFALGENMGDFERLMPRGKSMGWIAGLVSVLLATAYGSATAGLWKEVLLFLNAQPFGAVDPIFDKDVGFYVFSLPIINALKSAAVSLPVVALVGVTLFTYATTGGASFVRGLPIGVRRHLFSIAALALAAGALSFWYGRYGLMLSSSSVVFGPGYADVNARMPAMALMTVVSLIAAGVMAYAAVRRDTKPAWISTGAFVIAAVLALGVYPRLIQGIVVGPNELQKEGPYIENNIKGTRLAYGIDEVQEVPFEASGDLTAEDIRNNDATIRNARLWDWRPLRSTYSQIQEIRLYYDFVDADVDRYVLNGMYRQVLLSVRELNYQQIPARAATWVNKHLKYTHGYGLCMSPVDEVTPEGLPYLLIKDIPPVSTVDLNLDQPAVYYGELPSEYVLVRTSTEEFDYPMGEQNKFTRYEGEGGVPIGNLWNRLLFAWRFKDTKLLLTQYLEPESKIMFRRHLRARAPRIADFLSYDRDPYPVVLDGRILWVWDAYTVTGMYPYSEPYQVGLNYIRNAVKVVVDAYDGDVSFYVSDPGDPLIKAYSSIFPDLFRQLDQMPGGLREHLRYPVDLFEIQGRMFASYHMQDAQVFYNKEDQWSVPLESYAGEQRRMESYYVVMRIPGEEEAEFIIMLPFTPTNKDNMVAWLSGRCDGEHYGKLMVFLFPKQKLVFGPRQIEARIDQDPSISELLTLWSQKGSRVIRGNLLVIPIEQSLLYLEPLYIMAEEGELPELKRVIISFGGRIAMAENLRDALGAVFAGYAGAPGVVTGEDVPQAIAEELGVSPEALSSALAIFRRAQDHLRNGRWAEYGAEMEALERELERLASEGDK